MRATSVSLCLSLVLSSGGFAEVAKGLPARPFEHTLTPPLSIGALTDVYHSPDPQSRRVILIQDLHAHPGVQRNIAGLLEFLTRQMKDAEKPDSIPFALAVEGASGPIDSSAIALYPASDVKTEALDYLMREGELTGMEYFAANHSVADLLRGVEKNELYDAHRELFRKTFAEREELVSVLQGVQSDLQSLSSRILSPDVLLMERRQRAFEAGRCSMASFVKYLRKKAAPLGIEIASQARFEDVIKLSYLIKSQLAKTPQEKNLIQMEHSLEVFRQEGKKCS